MKVSIGFINGRNVKFDVDSFHYYEYEHILKLEKGGKVVGLIPMTQVTYWFYEED